MIGPYVETASQARGLVGAVRLSPLKGRRLAEAQEDDATLEDALREYLDQRNQHRLLIFNIESVPAMENLDEILSVPGIDSVLIGPHDLSCSLGIPELYDHLRFDKAVRRTITTARAHQVGAGIHYLEQHGTEDQMGSRRCELDHAQRGLSLFYSNDGARTRSDPPGAG